MKNQRKKTIKHIGSGIAIALFFGLIVSSAGAYPSGPQGSLVTSPWGTDENQPVPLDVPQWQRIRNRICDMLGICQGGCALEEITGILTYDGVTFYLDDIEVHFGPIWFITSAESAVDYDHDGVKETVFDELQGLVGTTVTLEGHFQSDSWMSVFTINGEIYREPGQPIWASQHQWRWGNRKGPHAS
jgi:hypothetical protein